MLLALDTATATASIALYSLERDLLLAEMTWQARRRHTQDLMGAVDYLLRHCGISVVDLGALAVTTGPGSFTGVRIGISIIKGIGLGLTRPPRVIGLPSLCVTVAPWLTLANCMGATNICAFIHAGRGRYNWALFNPAQQLHRPSREDHGAGTLTEFQAALEALAPQTVWLIGEADQALLAAAQPLSHICATDATSSLRRAGHLARLAGLHLAAGASDDLGALHPLYLQTP